MFDPRILQSSTQARPIWTEVEQSSHTPMNLKGWQNYPTSPEHASQAFKPCMGVAHVTTRARKPHQAIGAFFVGMLCLSSSHTNNKAIWASIIIVLANR